jgi:hypothetical protein
MTAGVPGLGLSGLFTLLSALYLPLNRRKAPSPVGRLVKLAVAMGVVLLLASTAFTDAVAAFGNHVVASPSRHLAGIFSSSGTWRVPLILVSAAIMLLLLAAGEALLHLVGPRPTPTPPPVSMAARPGSHAGEAPGATGGA